MSSARGRFYVERHDGGWQTVDRVYSTTIWAETRARAEDNARFFREYVTKHGDINLTAAPWDLDSPLEPFCPECGTLDLPCWTHDTEARAMKEGLT